MGTRRRRWVQNNVHRTCASGRPSHQGNLAPAMREGWCQVDCQTQQGPACGVAYQNLPRRRGRRKCRNGPAPSLSSHASCASPGWNRKRRAYTFWSRGYGEDGRAGCGEQPWTAEKRAGPVAAGGPGRPRRLDAAVYGRRSRAGVLREQRSADGEQCGARGRRSRQLAGAGQRLQAVTWVRQAECQGASRRSHWRQQRRAPSHRRCRRGSSAPHPDPGPAEAC